jgi:hypothetical protein
LAAGVVVVVLVSTTASLVAAPAAWARVRPVTALTSPPPLAAALSWTTGPLTDAGAPIARSSPTVADLDGQPSVVVGDRRGYVYAFHLHSTSMTPTSVAGFPTTNESGPIDSPPSIQPSGGGSSIIVGSGDDADPRTGGYTAYSAGGHQLWFTRVVNPSSDTAPDGGVQAGITLGTLQGGAGAVAGSLGQVSYALDAANGRPLTGWPFFNSDSTHSTAALADLYGTGQNQIIVGGDQSAGVGRGQRYTDGGHLRILSAQGQQICRADTDQVVDSSPAVGGILAGGKTGIVVGTGSYFSGAPDTDTVKAYDGDCQLQWSTRVDGSTFSSPALSDVLGNGSLQVVEGTDRYPADAGSVWVLDPENGRTLWRTAVDARIIGSVVTADLTGEGYDDVIAPTTAGAVVLDGRTGQQVADLSPDLGLQNSPLVTDDPGGAAGITLAGYTASGTTDPAGVGRIDHYQITGSNGALAVGAGSWPMFHRNPQLTGNAGGTPSRGSIPWCSVPAAVFTGYHLAASDGGIFSFGGAPFCGSTGGIHLNAPVVALAQSPLSGGYWEVASDGGIFAFGGARFYGSMGGHHLNKPVVGMAATPDGRGYWEVASDGGIFAFGDAHYYGSMGGRTLTKPVVGMTSSTEGNGYRLVASDGGIFSFGGAPFLGSMGGLPLNKPVVATVNDTNPGGYWEVASDGGVFSFGGAPFYGSTGAIRLNRPVVGMAQTANGSGYRFVASDGGIFSFEAPFLGSMGGRRLARPVVGMSGF